MMEMMGAANHIKNPNNCQIVLRYELGYFASTTYKEKIYNLCAISIAPCCSNSCIKCNIVWKYF